LFLVVLCSQLGTLKLCVFRTWQKSHSVYVSVSVPVDGVVLLCRWLVCDCSHTLTNDKFLRMRNIKDKICRENQNTLFVFDIYFTPQAVNTV
jgi:hypothetical protein